MDLKRNLFDNIKECEMKIGYREEDMNLYYPRESLMELLLADQEHLSEEIAAFCRLAAQELGDVTIKETEDSHIVCETFTSNLDELVSSIIRSTLWE